VAPAKKKTVKKKKRVSTREPKTIIKRKKVKGKGKVGRPKKTSAVKKEATAKLADDSKFQADVKALMKKHGDDFDKIAKLLKAPRAKVKRAYLATQVKPGDRVVGTDAEVGKAIVKMRDTEGLTWPEIRVRAGVSGVKARELYAKAGGKGERPAKEKAPKKKLTKKEKADRLAAKKEARAKKAGRPKGARARRDERKKLLVDVIWNLDVMDKKKIADVLEDRTISIAREINGHALRAVSFKVRAIKSVKPHDREGKLIEFVDTNHQTRFVAAREIAEIK